MDQGSNDIRQDIESTRSSLDAKLSLLENKATEATENVKQAFDIKSQVAERPWTALGVAIAAGYVLGTLGGDESTPSYYQSSGSSSYTPAGTPANGPSTGPSATDKLKEKGADFLSQFDDEIDVIKGAAIATLTGLLRDTVREYVPAMSQHLDDALRQRGLPLTSASGSGRSSDASPAYSSSGGYGSPSSYTPQASSGSSSGGRQVSSAPTASMSAAADMPNADYDNIGQMNRVGRPPANNAPNSEYYETYTPGTSSDQPEPPSISARENARQSSDETRNYTQ